MLIGDAESRRGCLYQPGTGHGCQSLSRAAMRFPDDVIERRSVEAHWVAVFPVSAIDVTNVFIQGMFLSFRRFFLFCKGVLSDVNRYQEVTNFLILSAGNCIVTVI